MPDADTPHPATGSIAHRNGSVPAPPGSDVHTPYVPSPDDYRVINLGDVRHAAEIDLAAAVDARTQAVRLFLQVATLCGVAVEAQARAADALAMASRAQADATVDELTGALRRGSGFAALRHEIDRARRTGTPLVVGFLDVDGLKEVNDTFGHTAGDTLLCSVVAALRASLRSYDVVVRYGGDEFVYSLAGADISAAVKRFRTMRTLLSDREPLRTVSAGFAELDVEDDLESLVARADADLYAHRATGRG